MSDHYQLHGMTSLYAPIIMKLRSPEETSDRAKQVQTARGKLQEHLTINDDHNAESVNSIDTQAWVITNLSYPTNYIPKNTVYRHISFIPTNVPDFRKVGLSVKDYTEFSSGPLKSTDVNRQFDTINKPEIKMMTTITGDPVINEAVTVANLPEISVMATSLTSFLRENLVEGVTDMSLAELKLDISNKIKSSVLQQSVKNILYDVVDSAFRDLTTGIVANKQQANDTYTYIVERILNKTT